MTVGNQWSSGTQEAAGPLVRFKHATLEGSTDKVPETISILGFVRPKNGNFWTVSTIYGFGVQITFAQN